MDFVPIAPDALRSVWDGVKEGLAKMPAEDWIAEDVYHAIKAGHVALFIGYNHAGYAGFFVLQQLKTEFTKQPVLHVWLAYNHGDADVFAEAEGFIRETAQRMGATKITFGSPRKGWAKRYPLVTANYEVPL